MYIFLIIISEYFNTLKCICQELILKNFNLEIPENKKLFCGVFCFPLMVVQILVVRYVFFSLLQGMSLDLEEIRNIYNLSVYGIKKGEL